MEIPWVLATNRTHCLTKTPVRTGKTSKKHEVANSNLTLMYLIPYPGAEEDLKCGL